VYLNFFILVVKALSGIMEYWNDGIMEEEEKCISTIPFSRNPLFQFSNIPSFQL
jgi:hypothetical protein